MKVNDDANDDVDNYVGVSDDANDGWWCCPWQWQAYYGWTWYFVHHYQKNCYKL